MKRNKFSATILIIAIMLISIVAWKFYQNYLNSKKKHQPTDQLSENWQIYSNNDFSISLEYPDSWTVESKKQNPAGSVHEYFFEKKVEAFRLHIYKENRPATQEYYQKTVSLGKNEFDVILFPKGLDSGDMVLTQPILYYIIYRNGVKYSFQFNNQEEINSIQEQILSSVELN